MREGVYIQLNIAIETELGLLRARGFQDQLKVSSPQRVAVSELDSDNSAYVPCRPRMS